MKENLNPQTHQIKLPNKITLWVETFGSKSLPAVVLLNPGSGQCISWPDSFCSLLANDYYVIRFDYRDAGLSSPIIYEDEPYDLNDLFKDALFILDHFNIAKAHFIGNSLGGFVLQYGAINWPERIDKMCIMMSSPHHSIFYETLSGVESHYFKLPPPDKELIKTIIEVSKQPKKANLMRIRQNLKLKKLAAGQGDVQFDQAYWYHLEEQLQRRSINTPNTNINLANAIKKHPENRLEKLKSINIPTLIIHGEADPVFHSEHAQAMCSAIRNAKMMLIPNMGHNFEPYFINNIHQAFKSFIFKS